MEDFKHRLKFSDLAVRSRCMQKLVHAVKRKSRGELVTSSTIHIPELNLIWETCLDSTSTTSNLAVQAIVYLVTNHHLDVTYTINKLLSVCTNSNAFTCVKGITNILMNQHNQSGAKLFTICQPKHPLIMVLQSNVNFLPLIFESIADAISEDHLKGFQVMEPVICYLLCNPCKKKNYYSTISLLETLIDVVKSEPKTAFYILRCIPYFQVEDYDQVAEAANFIIQSKRAFSSLQSNEEDQLYISELLLLAALSLTERSLSVGYAPNRLLKISIEIGLVLTKLNRVMLYKNQYLILIGIILRGVSGKILEKCVQLALILLNFQDLSPTVAAFAASIVTEILPEPSVISFGDEPSPSLSQLLGKLETLFLQSPNLDTTMTGELILEENIKEAVVGMDAFTLSAQSATQCVAFALQVDRSEQCARMEWLQSITGAVESSGNGSLSVLFSLVGSLFLMSPDECSYVESCLAAFESILRKDNSLACKVLSLLLYKLSLLKSTETKFLILEFLPKSATHKFAIPPVLNVLNVMSKDTDLRPQAIHLMLQLWRKHNRCFPYLHKLLIENYKGVNKELGINDAFVAQTAAIKQICIAEPEKHGVEFLGIVSKIFNESSDGGNSAATCLALDAVISLCQSEVTDLRSTWKELGPWLCKDKRPVVACRMYKLLSLIPELQVKSPEYEKFITEIVSFIWKLISSGIMSDKVVAAAYTTLSKFPVEYHVLKELPPPAKINLQLPASMTATPFDMGKLPEDVLTYIPGSCYLDLLTHIESKDIVHGYTDFLNSVIKQEVENLPRSVYSQRRLKKQSNNEALAKIPQFLCEQIASRKSPALQKNIAVGVLLCYEPPIELGKDGEPIKRSLATQYRLYEQVLGALLNEVNVDSTEWQRCLLLPCAWSSFMERAFFACEESRKAEMELQLKLGHLTMTTPEFNNQCKSAWMWVRDRLFNLIKTSVKNAPTSHANAVFAVSALVKASEKFYNGLDDNSKELSDDNASYVKQEEFASECTDTILCATSSNYQVKGKVYSWLLTHLSRPNSSAGFLINGCSCSSLFLLTSVLTSLRSDGIPNLLRILLGNLTHASPVLGFYSGIGLGMMIHSLVESGYADTGESQISMLFETMKNIYEVYKEEDKFSSNTLICLTLAMSALNSIANDDLRDWTFSTFNLLRQKLLEEDDRSMNFEILSVCVSAITISAVEGNSIPLDELLSFMSWFEEKQSLLPQCSGVSVSCGILIEALERFGHSKGPEVKQALQKNWFNTLASEKKPILQRIAALNGLCSLFSCGRGLLQVKSCEKDSKAMPVNDLVSLMFQILNVGRDTGLQSICSWEIGRLYSVHSFQQESDEAVPSSYFYLNEKSTLKPLVKMIINNSQSGSENISIHMLACLKALGGSFTRPMPPLNWTSLLTPFLQNTKDFIVVEAALDIAVHQAKGSPYALSVLSSYCCPPLYTALPEKCKEYLLKNITELLPVLPPQKLKTYLKTIIIKNIINNSSGYVCKDTLKGLKDAFSQPDLKQPTQNVLRESFISVFKFFKTDSNLIHRHLQWISDILLLLPDKAADSMLSVSKNCEDVAVLTVVMCFLIKTGKRTISSLRPYIEEGKHSSQEEKEKIYAAIYECFLYSEVIQMDKCISFVLETIGWINVLNDTKSQYQLLTVKDVFIYLNGVCISAIIGCSGIHCSYRIISARNLNHTQLFEMLPVSIASLLQRSEWNSIIDKITQWQLMLLESPHMTPGDKSMVKKSLRSMKTSSELWINIVQNTY